MRQLLIVLRGKAEVGGRPQEKDLQYKSDTVGPHPSKTEKKIVGEFNSKQFFAVLVAKE
jgi:hypothetical protein